MVSTTPQQPPHLYVIDDDAAFRRSMSFLLEPMGWAVHAFASAQEFLDAFRDAGHGTCSAGVPMAAGCLLLDIRMPRMSGLELQRELARLGCHWPIIFLTGHADVELAVQAMKAGAFDFLEKPFKNQRLIDTVGAALEKLDTGLLAQQDVSRARSRLEKFSPREREVAHRIAKGMANKLVARDLDISEKTVHIHRQHVMEKAAVGSAAELARLMLKADPMALDRAG